MLMTCTIRLVTCTQHLCNWVYDNMYSTGQQLTFFTVKHKTTFTKLSSPARTSSLVPAAAHMKVDLLDDMCGPIAPQFEVKCEGNKSASVKLLWARYRKTNKVCLSLG